MATNSGQFSKSILTTAGKEMIAQSQNGHTLTFTRVALGDGVLDDGENPSALKAVKREKLSAGISSFTDKGNGQFTVQFNVNNRKLTKGFFHREIGLMAKIDEEEEQLYAYSYAGTAASFLYDNTTPVQERVVNLDFLIGDVTDAKIEINGSVVYLTRKETEKLVTDHNESEDAHPYLRTLIANSGINILKRRHTYEVGDIAYSPLLKSYQRLECVVGGTSAGVAIDVSSSTTGG